MPSDLALKTMNRVHRVVLTLSFGKLGWRAGGMPALELTTVGRRSGEPRASMLTSPVQEGDALVIVASRGGDDAHPAWYLNLQAHPEVTVRYGGGQARAMRARTVEGAERDRLWKAIVSSQPRYAGYQSKTERVIPVVVLDPIA